MGAAACFIAGCGSDNNTPVETAGGTQIGTGNGAGTGTGGIGATAGKTAQTPRGGRGGSGGKKTTTGGGGRARVGGARQTGGAGGKPTTKTCDKIPPSSIDCAAKLAPGDDRTCTIQVAGQERTFLLLAPKLYNPCNPTPLVVDAHGVTETAREEAGIDSFCSAPPFPTGCYPKGTGSSNPTEVDLRATRPKLT